MPAGEIAPAEVPDLRDFAREHPELGVDVVVGESMRNPGHYWRENVNGALNLVEATVAAGIRHFVFSSTCATYGDQDGVVLDENTPQRPINAYGASKRAIEDILANFEAAHGLQSVIFRYFNVAGADPDGEVGEQHEPETHLIPLMLDAITGKRPALTVFGRDYPTPDGTCIRDYVHVSDLAEAHVLGLNWLRAGKGSRVFCLGTGSGFAQLLLSVIYVNGTLLGAWSALYYAINFYLQVEEQADQLTRLEAQATSAQLELPVGLRDGHVPLHAPAHGAST